MAAIHGVILGAGGNPYIDATGGVVTDITIGAAKWRVHKFVTTASFIVHRTGVVFNDLEYLVQGGGGGGGAQTYKPAAGSGGGGGGAAPKSGVVQAIRKTYPATVGVGGPANTNGGDSIFNSLISKGGGGGGAYGTNIPGLAGGSGGGAGQPFRGGSATGGAATDGGSRGGDVNIPSPKETGGGGGGGGAGSPGANAYGAISPFNGGNGGNGVTTSISGTLETLGAGGGGAGCNASAESGTGTGEPGLGGSASVGGDGAMHSVRGATAPVANTGSGGGGGNGADWSATPGAAGVIYVRYRIG